MLAEKLGLSHQALVRRGVDLVGPIVVADQLLPGARLVPASPANSGYKPGFTTALMLKDLKLAQEAAARPARPRRSGPQADAALCAASCRPGQGGADFSGIIEFVRARSWSKVR